MLKQYKTILNPSEAELTEKKSRFIATVRPIKHEEEAKLFLEEMKKKYWDASHNVFAYQLGENNEIQRFSDDGEPQGTAGLPILNVLKGEDIKNTIIIVTRYFGGTLLGTGGLVRCYGKVAKAGLAAAGICERILYCEYCLRVDYSFVGKIQYEIMQKGYVLKNSNFTELAEFVVLVKVDEKESFESLIIEITGAKATMLFYGEKYGAWINGLFEIVD